MKTSRCVVLCGIAFSALVVAQPYRFAVVSGASMSPTYKSGDFVLTSRDDSDLRRGDAVVFDHEGETLVKRVAFLPGDRILEFKFKESWFAPINDFMLTRVEHDHIPSKYVTIPPGQLYVLGDNTSEAVDSRTFGTIPASSVIGKVVDAPKPQLISGFAGTVQVDSDTSSLETRREPVTGMALTMAERYDARVQRLARAQARIQAQAKAD